LKQGQVLPHMHTLLSPHWGCQLWQTMCAVLCCAVLCCAVQVPEAAGEPGLLCSIGRQQLLPPPQLRYTSDTACLTQLMQPSFNWRWCWLIESGNPPATSGPWTYE